MNFLLDTHTFLWFINDDPALSPRAAELIEDPSSNIFLSVASLWEMAIKISLGRLETPSPFDEFIISQLNENNIILLDIKAHHVGIVAVLPFHHRDPFDRMIVAQSQSEDVPIISKDEVFDSYALRRYW